MGEPAATPRTHKAMRAESDGRIIAAAIEAFADRGYHRTTLGQIGKAAGYSGPLISRRYGSKAGLARVVFAHILQRLTPLGTDPTDREAWVDESVSARRQLDGFIRSYLRDAAEEPTRLRALYVLIGEALGGMDEIDDEVAHVNRVFREHIASYVALGQQQHEFRADLDPARTAVVIVGALRGVVTQVLAEPADHDPTRLIDELRRHLVVPLLRDPQNENTDLEGDIDV